jgi:hypothetical protein
MFDEPIPVLLRPKLQRIPTRRHTAMRTAGAIGFTVAPPIPPQSVARQRADPSSQRSFEETWPSRPEGSLSRFRERAGVRVLEPSLSSTPHPNPLPAREGTGAGNAGFRGTGDRRFSLVRSPRCGTPRLGVTSPLTEEVHESPALVSSASRSSLPPAWLISRTA